MEADNGGAITIINKEDYTPDCNTLHEDNSTYHKTTTDMRTMSSSEKLHLKITIIIIILMQTHLKEAENLLNSITVVNKQIVSKLLPTQA